MSTVLITGVLGQDGTYLAEYLSGLGDKVYGLARRNSDEHPRRHLLPPSVTLLTGDVTDPHCLLEIQQSVRPDEIYHLAAQSHVGQSFLEPRASIEVTGIGTLNVLEAVRKSGVNSRVYVASTSELFGGLESRAYRETDRFHPRSPYGCAKLYSHSLAVHYREAYKTYVACGILFNHESPRRGPEFVTRKITRSIARVLTDQAGEIPLGNLDARRDWGFAGDYVRGMAAMLRQTTRPADYVLATGQSHSVKEFLDMAWDIGVSVAKSKRHKPGSRPPVRYDMGLMRPTEVPTLVGDAHRARVDLGWSPRTPFDQLVRMMVVSDLTLERGRK